MAERQGNKKDKLKCSETKIKQSDTFTYVNNMTHNLLSV